MGERCDLGGVSELSAQQSAKDELDELVCHGAALDLFEADQARRLFEELDLYVRAVNDSGVGRKFFGAIQLILERHLCLSVTRFYEQTSPRNPGRSIWAAIQCVRSRARELQVLSRDCLIKSMSEGLDTPEALNQLADEDLSLKFVRHLDAALPRVGSGSLRPLDQALDTLKRTRDKALAHHDMVDRTTLLVPAWPKLIELIETGRNVVVNIARCYLNVSYSLERDAAGAAVSLRQLMKRAGLTASTVRR